MKDEALVFGSLAFDYIMPVYPTLREEIPLKNGKIESLNIALVSDTLTILPGGTAGNIAFGIAFLGGKATIHSVAGRDFMATYGERLRRYKINLSVKIYDNYETAHAYMISDKNNEQIIIWQPNVIKFIDDLELSAIIKKRKENYKVAIFAPGTAKSTMKGLRSVQSLDSSIIKIFDPGQMLLTYSKDEFYECLEMTEALIMNDAEWDKANNFGLNFEKAIQNYPDKIFIQTLGEKGSQFYVAGEKFWVGIAKPDEIVEVTGAGDAFRAGLIKGLLDGNDWRRSAKLGASLASLCVETQGGQGYEVFDPKIAYERSETVPVKNGF